jgi:hypothetical protein
MLEGCKVFKGFGIFWEVVKWIYVGIKLMVCIVTSRVEAKGIVWTHEPTEKKEMG